MMDATRTRLSFTGEWITAAALLAGTILVGSLVVRELRVAPRAFAPADVSSATAATVPPDGVSVPTLMLGPTTRIAVGDGFDQAIASLDASVMTLVVSSRERGPLGVREIRSYSLAGTKFTIVAEPFERNGKPRIASIYLQ
jgi:hypothetical protein